MAKLTPRNVAVTDQILAVLSEAYPLPVSTGEVEERTGYGIPYGQLTYRMLQRLADLGEIEKITLPDVRSRYWRKWPQEPGRDSSTRELEAGQ
jgi:hypothetical protein